MPTEILGIGGTVLPADLPPDLVALAQVSPIVEQELRDPLIPKDVHDFMDQELRVLGMYWGDISMNGHWTMEAALQAINDIRAERSLPLVEV